VVVAVGVAAVAAVAAVEEVGVAALADTEINYLCASILGYKRQTSAVFG
jgi:hypothetical protein